MVVGATQAQKMPTTEPMHPTERRHCVPKVLSRASSTTSSSSTRTPSPPISAPTVSSENDRTLHLAAQQCSSWQTAAPSPSHPRHVPLGIINTPARLPLSRLRTLRNPQKWNQLCCQWMALTAMIMLLIHHYDQKLHYHEQGALVVKTALKAPFLYSQDARMPVTDLQRHLFLAEKVFLLSFLPYLYNLQTGTHDAIHKCIRVYTHTYIHCGNGLDHFAK